jgi:hypothetical protein
MAGCVSWAGSGIQYKQKIPEHGVGNCGYT